jgi:putative DNA primase/helicase
MSVVLDVEDRFSRLRREFEGKMHLEKADGQVYRVADLFILYVLTGELACEFGVFSHRFSELKDMVFELFERWLDERGSIDSMEEKAILQHVVGFLEQNNARFQNIILCGDGKKPEEPRGYNNSLGFREVTMQNNEEIEIYYIIPPTFNDDICSGMNKKLVKKVLKEAGILILDSEGKNPKCPYTVPSNKRRVKLIIKNKNLDF